MASKYTPDTMFNHPLLSYPGQHKPTQAAWEQEKDGAGRVHHEGGLGIISNNAGRGVFDFNGNCPGND
jgi:hypothetical protein